MNVFVLDQNPKLAAQMHLDRHIVKMVIEYAQLLSTAHRVCDGSKITKTLPTGKTQKLRLLPGESIVLETRQNLFTKNSITKYYLVDQICYSLSHHNHPCAIWARESDSNYQWLYSLFLETATEYTHRYGKIHKTWVDIGVFLANSPKNIPIGPMTPFPQAMGEEFKIKDDSIEAYKNYYLGPKAAFARWTNRKPPTWFIAGTKNYDVSNFERTR